MIVLIQFILTALACAGLWWAWTKLAGRGKASLIIAAGFIIRALGGQVLFWISWLYLPIAKSLQIGNGFWFFAIDGPKYLSYALELVGLGAKAILFITTGYQSRLFTQAFAIATAAFGVVSSVAILFNCAAYLATCAILLRIGSRDARMERPRLVALAAIAFGPGMVLWSLQALKDTYFYFLVIALFAACLRWQEVWKADANWRRLLGPIAVMLVVMYEIGGIRWYFGAFFCALWPVFVVLTSLSARWRWKAALSGLLLLVLLTQALRLGGGDDIPWQVRRLLAPGEVKSLRWWRPAPAEVSWQPSAVPQLAVEIRSGFEHTPGATKIAPGPVVGTVPPVSKSKEAVVVSPTLVPRLATGFAAMFLPRFVAQALGLIRIGGGRGFWIFVETDTLVFDAMLLFSAIYCTRALRSWARMTPLFVFLVLLFVMTAAPMIYTVTNFGTLFRLRLMVYVIAAVLPLTLAGRRDAA